MRVALNLRSKSPVAFRAGRDAGGATTLPYIPGPVLLGGFAAAHSVLYPDQTERFTELFLQGQVRYGNAYPASFAQRELQDEIAAMQPLPATARSCKRWPGFRFQRDADHDYHGVFDHLLPLALFALSGERVIAPLEHAGACTECGGTLESLSGFYRRRSVGAVAAAGRSSQDTVVLTRAGISRATGAAHPGILYSREALPEGIDFWSELLIPDELFEPFQAFAMKAAGEGLLRVGANRTRGLGWLGVVGCEKAESDTPEAVAGRVREWNKALRAAAEKAGVPVPPGCYVPLTLTSDALSLDPMLRWRLRLEGDVLASAGVPGAALVYHAASVRLVTGWNGAWGLPREDALAIGMGSVFLMRFEQEPDACALLNLQDEGFGERRSEGFGRVVVADPFHWEVHNA